MGRYAATIHPRAGALRYHILLQCTSLASQAAHFMSEANQSIAFEGHRHLWVLTHHCRFNWHLTLQVLQQPRSHCPKIRSPTLPNVAAVMTAILCDVNKTNIGVGCLHAVNEKDSKGERKVAILPDVGTYHCACNSQARNTRIGGSTAQQQKHAQSSMHIHQIFSK